MRLKCFGVVWRVYFGAYREWHQPESEPSVRRAWWWLCHWPKYGNYCLRVVGITLFGRKAKERG